MDVKLNLGIETELKIREAVAAYTTKAKVGTYLDLYKAGVISRDELISRIKCYITFRRMPIEDEA